MARNELQIAAQNWGNRVALLRRFGVEDSVWKKLAEKDIDNVLRGHSPMSNAEVNDAFATARGNAQIKDPEEGSSLFDIPGNIASDIGGIVTNFVPGVAGYVTSLPEQAVDFVKLAQQDPETQRKYGMEVGGEGGIGGFIRNAARTPVFGPLVPGLHTLASTTTEEGRTEIAQHPVSTAIDVMYAAGEAGKLATKGRVAEAGSATEAFQQRKPLRGAIRGTADVLANATGKQVFSRAAFNQSLLDAGLHPDIVTTVARPLQEIKSAQQREMRDWIRGPLFESMKDLTDEQRRTLSDAAKNPGVNDANILALPTELQTILGNVRQFNKAMEIERQGDGLFTVRGPDGKNHVFSEESPVVKTFKRAIRSADLAQRAVDKLLTIRERASLRQGKLETRYGKIRRFNETAEDFAARESGPVTPDVIREAATPLVESFAHLDPLEVYGRGIFTEGVSQQALTSVLRDVKALSGEDGLLAKWDTAMASGDLLTARRTLTQIKQKFAHGAWDRTPYAQTFRTHIRDIQREMVGMQQKMRSLGFGMKTLQTSLRDERRALGLAKRTAETAAQSHATHLETLTSTPPAAYHPLIAKLVKTGAKDIAATKFAHSVEDMDAAMKGIEQATDFKELGQWIGEDEARQLIHDAKRQWLELSKSGIDPIFVHNVTGASLKYVTRPSVLPNRFYTPGVVKNKIFNVGDSVHDVLAAVTDYKRQLISEAGTARFITDHLSQWVRDELEVKKELRAAMENHPRREFMDLDALVQKEINAHYSDFDPERFGFARYVPGAAGKKLLIPKGVDRSLSALMRDNRIPVEGIYDKTINMWKLAVLTTPRHLSHVALGGAMMGALREPGFIRQLGKAHAIVKADTADFLNVLSRNVNDLSPDQVFAYASGKSMGRMLAEAAGTPARALNRLEEHIASTLKVSGMLSGEARGLTREQAISLANKTFVDMNGMTPFERVTMRKVFPFYGFTRHLFRYLMTYPIDHPLRAAILTNLANQHKEDWSTGLPGNMSFLFFLGSPDEAGNVHTVDYRSIDPFRSFFNEFTLAGITSQINPLAQIPLQMMGVNVLAATPELYPGSHYDPELGTIVAERPSDSPLATIAHGLIPETVAVDAVLGLTDRFRHLKETNERAYHRAIFTALGIPFEPSTINVPYEKERAAQGRFRDAQNAISEAMISGNFDDVKRYNQVPVPSLLRRFFPNSAYASPGDIEALWGALTSSLGQQGAEGISPKAIIPKGR